MSSLISSKAFPSNQKFHYPKSKISPQPWCHCSNFRVIRLIVSSYSHFYLRGTFGFRIFSSLVLAIALSLCLRTCQHKSKPTPILSAVCVSPHCIFEDSMRLYLYACVFHTSFPRFCEWSTGKGLGTFVFKV